MSTQLTSHGSPQVSDSSPTAAETRSQSPLTCDDQPESLYIEDAHPAVRLCHQAILTAVDDLVSAWRERGTADVEEASAWMQKALKEHPHNNASRWLKYMPLKIEKMREWYSANPPAPDVQVDTSDPDPTQTATSPDEVDDFKDPQPTARQTRELSLRNYFIAKFGRKASRNVFEECNDPLLHGKEGPFSAAMTTAGQTSREQYAWEIYKESTPDLKSFAEQYAKSLKAAAARAGY